MHSFRRLGLDIATTSGFGLLDRDQLVVAGTYRAQGADDGEIFDNFSKWLHSFIVQHGVREVAIEQPLRTPQIATIDGKPTLSPPSNMDTYLRLYGLRAHALSVCRSLNIDVYEVNQATWRAQVLGNGHADKDDAVRWCNVEHKLNVKSKDACEGVCVAWWLLMQRDPAAAGLTGDMFAASEQVPA